MHNDCSNSNASAMELYRIMYGLKWRTVYVLTSGSFWCLFLWVVQQTTREINTKIKLEWAHKQFIMRVHIKGILQKGPYLPCISMAGRALLAGYHRCINIFLTWHNESVIDDRMTIFPHQPRVSHARFTFCWWCHNDQTIVMWACEKFHTGLFRYWIYSQGYSQPVM